MKNNKLATKPKHFYDRYYKYIFKNVSLIEALVKFILPDKLINKLNWNTLKAEETHFVPKNLKSREADEIFEIKLTNNEKIYIYFLVEFQTSVDKLMALRIYIYIALFYHQLLSMNRIKKGCACNYSNCVIHRGCQMEFCCKIK